MAGCLEKMGRGESAMILWPSCELFQLIQPNEDKTKLSEGNFHENLPKPEKLPSSDLRYFVDELSVHLTHLSQEEEEWKRIFSFKQE